MKKYYGYLKLWEVSRYLGIPLAEIEDMVEQGELPSTTVDGTTRVPWDQLEAWLDEDVDEDALDRLGKRLDADEKSVKGFLGGKTKKPKEAKKAKAGRPKKKPAK